MLAGPVAGSERNRKRLEKVRRLALNLSGLRKELESGKKLEKL